MLVLLPCGSCLACRAARSKDWANRCYLESLGYDENYFITLTYDDNNCPLELVKSHVQKFVKDLRNNGFEFRYFLCGEYGSRTGRPHYHLLAFGLHLTDLVFHSKSAKDFKMFTSDTISKYWIYGFVSICDMTPETICYTARYCTKKLGSKDFANEFILMSRRPGLGYSWIEKHYHELIDDQHLYLGDYGVKGLSRYIKEFIKKKLPDIYQKMSENNKNDFSKSLISNRLKYKKSEEKILDDSHDSNIRRDLRNKRGNL